MWHLSELLNLENVNKINIKRRLLPDCNCGDWRDSLNHERSVIMSGIKGKFDDHTPGGRETVNTASSTPSSQVILLRINKVTHLLNQSSADVCL